MVRINGYGEIQSTNCVFDLSEFFIGTSINIELILKYLINIEVPIKNSERSKTQLVL